MLTSTPRARRRSFAPLPLAVLQESVPPAGPLDATHFHALHREFGPYVRSRLRRTLGASASRSQARAAEACSGQLEEAEQETWEAVYRQLLAGSLQASRGDVFRNLFVLTWRIATRARQRGLAERRADLRVPDAPDMPEPELPGAGPTPEEVARAAQLARLVETRLTSAQRDILFADEQAANDEEVARHLGMSPANVRKQRQRLRQSLRVLLEAA